MRASELGRLAAVAVMTLLVSTPGLGKAEMRELTTEEMGAIRGGAPAITSFNRPHPNLDPVWEDNPVIDFNFNISNINNPSAIYQLEARLGTRKVAFQQIRTNAQGNGRFLSRGYLFPPGVSGTLGARFNAGGGTFVTLTGGLPNTRIDPRVEVHGFVFHNLTDGVEATAFPSGVAQYEIADNLDVVRTLSTTPSIDEMFRQCAVGSRIQIRSIRADTLTVPRNCTRFTLAGGASSATIASTCQGATTNAQILNMFDQLAQNNGAGVFHVFFVNALGGNSLGVYFRNNWALVLDSIGAGSATTARRTAVTIAHEYGHSLGLCHPFETCMQAQGTSCTQATTSNMMCNVNAVGNSGLNAAQCTMMYNTNTNGVLDLN